MTKPVFAIALIVLSASAFADMMFVRDSRGGGGSRKRLFIVNEDVPGRASVSLHTDGYSHVGGTNYYYGDTLGKGMSCQVQRQEGKVLSVHCAQDLRPVEGAMTEVIVLRDDQGTFDVERRLTYWDRAQGREVVKSSIVVEDLR
jgi:hypothetical protein